MLSIPPSVKLWFAGGVDLRLGFDGLIDHAGYVVNGVVVLPWTEIRVEE